MNRGMLQQRPSMAARMARSPGFAMANQAVQNIEALRQGQPMGESPVQAYQRHIANRAALRQQELDQQARMQAMNPFYEFEEAVRRGLVPRGTTLQDYNNLYAGNRGTQTIDERNLMTYRRLLQEAQKTGDQADFDLAERFAYSANLNTQSRGSPSLSGTDAARLDEATQGYITARRQSNRLNNLADQFLRSDLDAGVSGAAEDWFKRQMGTEDWESELRREQREIINSDVINNLPPGVASDRDIQIAREGYPTSYANKEYVASYFRGLAKIRALDADYQRFVADYISENGNQRNMVNAWDEYAREKYKGWGDEAPSEDTGGWSIERQ